MGRRMGQQASVLMASHQACQEHGWFLPYSRGGVERGGGLVPPPGRTKYKLSCDGAGEKAVRDVGVE